MYNGTSEAINFRLRGWAFLEYLYGIIDSPVVAAVDENGDEMEFYIEPGEELQLNNVVFQASRSQTEEDSLKVDRTLLSLYINRRGKVNGPSGIICVALSNELFGAAFSLGNSHGIIPDQYF